MSEQTCMIIGFNDYSFSEYCSMLTELGPKSAANRDLRLAYVNMDGAPRHALDVLNKLRSEEGLYDLNLSNADFMWPVVMVLGSYLHKHGLPFDYINQFQREKDVLASKLRSGKIGSVVITTTLYVMPHPVQEIVDFVRTHAPEVQIIIGGPYISGLFKSQKREHIGDYLSALGGDIYINSNEGEEALREVLQAGQEGKPLHGIANTAIHNGSVWVFGEDKTESSVLEENFVDYSLFQSSVGRFISTRTAKSCPYACAFCGFPQRAGSYRYLSTSDVERELDAVAALGSVDTLTFLDDTFNVPKKRFREILQMIIDNNYGFKWNSFYRSDQGDPETIELMARAGCEGVFLGIESASDKMLKLMRKTSRRKNYESALDSFNRVGISTHASFIIGFPGETLETSEESLDFIEEFRPTTFRGQVWYCDPLTPIWNDREKFGIKGSGFDWVHDTMDSNLATTIAERFFFNIKNSHWLPQFGFEQWSIFYLQRHGMSIDSILSYIEHFNYGVKHQLLHGDFAPLPESTVLGLKAGSALPFEPINTNAESYILAEEFAQAEKRLKNMTSPLAHGGQVAKGGSRCEITLEEIEKLQNVKKNLGWEIPFVRYVASLTQSKAIAFVYHKNAIAKLVVISLLSSETDRSLRGRVQAAITEAPALTETELYLLNDQIRLEAAGINVSASMGHVFEDSDGMASEPTVKLFVNESPYRSSERYLCTNSSESHLSL